MENSVILNIESIERKQKCYAIKAGGRTYYANFKLLGIEHASGKTIDAIIEENSTTDGKKFSWILSFEVKAGGAPPQSGAFSTPAPYAAGPSQVVDRFYMAFVSNVVAHAIQSGYIQDPSDISKWAKAARDAALALEDLFEIV